MKMEYLQTISKRDFAEILENFLTVGYLVFFFETPPDFQAYNHSVNSI